MLSQTLELPSNKHRLATIPNYWAQPKNRRKYTNRIENMLSRVIGHRFYIVLDSELPFSMDHEMLGAYHPQFPQHTAIQEAIVVRSRGEGPVVLFNDQGHGRYPEWEHSVLLSVAIHEAAHAINERVIPFDERLSTSGAERMVFEVTRPSSDWVKESHEQNHHDWRFIRALLHIAHRATSCGWSVNIWKLCDWQSHGYECPTNYRELLRNELLDRRPIREILRHPAPKTFIDAWLAEMCARAQVMGRPTTP